MARRNRELDTESKARAVLCRTGQPGNRCAHMNAAEIAELAAIYDRCLAPQQELGNRIQEFWGRRRERLEAEKAVLDDEPRTRGPFRHRRPQPPLDPPPEIIAPPADAATSTTPAPSPPAGEVNDTEPTAEPPGPAT